MAYVIPYNANVGTRQNPQWEKRANLQISPYGELIMRMRAGHIRHADRPVVVYDGDVFKIGTNEQGQKVIQYDAAIPRKSKTITACFIRIERIDGTVDFQHMLPDDWERLKAFSEKKNNGKANALYGKDGNIDPGFLEAKMIKHAFKTYPKIRIGDFTKLKSEETEEIKPINYGLDAPIEEAEQEIIEPDTAAFGAEDGAQVEEAEAVQFENDEAF